MNTCWKLQKRPWYPPYILDQLLLALMYFVSNKELSDKYILGHYDNGGIKTVTTDNIVQIYTAAIKYTELRSVLSFKVIHNF